MPIKIIKYQCAICGAIHDNESIQCRDCEENHQGIKKAVGLFEERSRYPKRVHVIFEDGATGYYEVQSINGKEQRK